MVNFYFICPLLLCFGLLEAQRHNSFGVPSLRSILSGTSGGAEHMDAVIENVGSVVQNVANNIDDNGDEDYGFTSLLRANNDSVQFPDTYVPPVSLIVTSQDSSDYLESRTLGPEPRIPPPEPTKTYNLRRTSPHDIVGFSAVRASGFSRMGDSRIFFENTVTDANYGWDSRNSIFITHFPGLYFFTFSVKADADKGDNFKYEVSLMKNGEEVVSVGGAIDPSNRNVGTSGSNSIILDLAKEDRVWLQLLRGNLVETSNRKTGYSTFTGYRLGCGIFNDKPADLSGVSLEDIAVNLDNESLLSLDESSEDNVDRYGISYKDKRPVYNDDNENQYTTRPHVYSDEKLYDAFEYEEDTTSTRGSLRPAHRPFKDNGPAIVEDQEKHNSQQDGYDDFFSLKDKSSMSDNRNKNRYSQDRYSQNRDRYSEDRDRYSDDRDRYSDDKDRYSEDRDRYSQNGDKLDEDRDVYTGERHQQDRDRVSEDRDRYSQDRDRYSQNRDKYPQNQDKYDQNGSNEGERYYHTKEKDSNTRYQQNWDRNSANRDRYATDRLGYAEDTDRYNTVQANNDLSEKETYQYRTPLVPDKVQSLNDRYKGSSDRFEEENGIREGTMFFHKRQIAEPSSDSVSHVSYGR